jgi:leucine-zipper of insertion element IS481
MKLHANARTCPKSRRLLVRRVEEEGWSLAAAAEAAGVSGRTAAKWLARHPMLESRLWQPVPFKSLSSQEVLQVIPQYHAIYRRARRDLLLLVDDVYAHGNFRRWARFTVTAMELWITAGVDTLTEEIARNGFGLQGGW